MTDSILKALQRGEVPVALVEEELKRTADMSDDGKTWTPEQFWEFVSGLTDDWRAKQMQDTMREKGLALVRATAVNQEERGGAK